MECEIYSLYLNEVRKNLAANLDRSPLVHSYGYTPVDDQVNLGAISSQRFVPCPHFAG